MNQVFDWSRYPRLYCFPDKCNCEPMRMGALIIQPTAVLSSIPFILIGIWAWLRCKEFEFKLLAACYVVLGFSSIFLHSSYILVSRYFDFGSIFAIMSWTLVYLYHSKTNHLKFFLWFLGVTAFMTSMLKIFPQQAIESFVVWAIVTIIFCFARVQSFQLNHQQKKDLYLSILFLVIGGASFQLDTMGYFCFPDWHLYGHSVWHLLVGISLIFHFRFFQQIHQHKKSV